MNVAPPMVKEHSELGYFENIGVRCQTYVYYIKHLVMVL